MASLFLLDTAGDKNLLEKKTHGAKYNKHNSRSSISHLKEDSEEDDDDQEDGIELFGIKLQSKDVAKLVEKSQKVTKPGPSKISIEMDSIAEKVNEAIENSGAHTLKNRVSVVNLDHSDFNKETGKPAEDLDLRKTNVALDMQSARRQGGFEQLKTLPRPSGRKQKELNRAERDKTKGSGWFDLPATEVTDEMHNELKIVQMRSVLDPKHFYKKNDLKVLPKYFQIGTVLHSPLDHYSERNTRKTKKSLVDELLEDEAFQKFNKRKYKEVIQRTDKYAHRKAMKKMKKLKKGK